VIEAFLARYGYLAVLALLVSAGVGVPTPEEPTQLAAGVMAQRGLVSLGLVIATCWVGIVVGDFLWFLIAQRLGPPVLERTALRKVLTPARRAKIEAHLSRHAFLTVMISRHLSGLRLAAFALAATHGVRRRTFALADGLSALVSVPLVVLAGYLGAHHLSRVRSDIRTAELAILAAVAAGAAIALLVRRLRRPRESADTPAARREA
jgi:membrane protein DedA with SNARE-associated domain